MRTTPGSWLRAIGFAFLLVGVAAGVGSGEFGLLLGHVGVLIGAAFIAAAFGVGRMGGAEPTTPTGQAACVRVGALTAFLRRNVNVAGLILASSAITAVAAGEAGPVLCFAMFAVFLLGLCLITIPVFGEE